MHLFTSKRLKPNRMLDPNAIWIDRITYFLRGKNEEELKNQRELYAIAKGADGKLSTKFRMPMMYCKKLNETFDLNAFNKRTDTKLSIPKTPDECIEISGATFDKVVEAREKLHGILNEIRLNAKALQFIAFPTVSHEVKENVKKFKEELLKLNISGMHESIFQKPEKLHITLGVFSLFDEAELEAAVEALIACKTEIIDPFVQDKPPLVIKLQGLDYMDDDVKKVNVLYAKAHFEGLQQLSNDVMEFFHRKGLLKEHRTSVKIHVTLINTRYRKNSGGRKWNKRISIDATRLMENYANYDFGSSVFDSVHLSLMGSVGDDGFYKSISVIKI